MAQHYSRIELIIINLYGNVYLAILKSLKLKIILFPLQIILQKKINQYENKYLNVYRYIAEKFFHLPVGKFSYGFWPLIGKEIESIGAFCSIARNLTIAGMHHPTEYISAHPFLFYKSRTFIEKDIQLSEQCQNRNKKIVIGNDVWIGENVTLLRGVKIGDGAIIGAGSLVNKDVDPYSIVGGVPIKFIKYRFNESMRSTLLKIKWWEWEDEKIKKNTHLFYSPQKFCDNFGINC